MQSQKGFTLMELMIAVALVAIITMIAIPSYSSYTERAARGAAQADLMAAASAMERRKAQNFSYENATAGTASTNTISSISPSDGTAASAKYIISIIFLESDGTPIEVGDQVTGYEIKAVSTPRFATGKKEAMKIDHQGRKCYKTGAATTDCTIGTDATWK